ncbi:hypothetical protein HS088_TW07G00126 [Tripterygium wilfordii]|uniref:Uncharacterized protein n=1 Tax=Tripterygium wilfordii TaxID=458696 RepID=A0A7J7DE08_TRIWF|nr:hypothetical protein HS088_TW07G00126 [Tripterygium wilfordii]
MSCWKLVMAQVVNLQLTAMKTLGMQVVRNLLVVVLLTILIVLLEQLWILKKELQIVQIYVRQVQKMGLECSKGSTIDVNYDCLNAQHKMQKPCLLVDEPIDSFMGLRFWSSDKKNLSPRAAFVRDLVTKLGTGDNSSCSSSSSSSDSKDE